jgi:hypothetical protein
MTGFSNESEDEVAAEEKVDPEEEVEEEVETEGEVEAGGEVVAADTKSRSKSSSPQVSIVRAAIVSAAGRSCGWADSCKRSGRGVRDPSSQSQSKASKVSDSVGSCMLMRSNTASASRRKQGGCWRKSEAYTRGSLLTPFPRPSTCSML